MANKKRHTPEEVVAKLRQVDVLVSQGQSVAEAIRAVSVTPFTYYRWRKEFGGLKTDQVKRLRELEKENERLRKAVSDLTLEKLILAAAARGVRGGPDPVRWTNSALNGRSPRAPPASLHRACQAGIPGLGAARLPGSRAASLDAAQGAAGKRG